MRELFRFRETAATIVCEPEHLQVVKRGIFEARDIIESKIADDPFFGITYDPYPPSGKDDPLIRRMCEASVLAGVGPMAGVAGAVAVYGVEAAREAGAREAIVENGGDIAFLSYRRMPIGVFADHPVFRDVAFDMRHDGITGICSSSAKIGPSVSFGGSDVCTVFSDDVILADCCATALGNLVTGEGAVSEALESIAAIEGVRGCMAVCGDKVAVCGDVPELIPARLDTVLGGSGANL